MAKPAESLIKYYEKSDEQTKELIVEKGKELAYARGDGWLGNINEKHHGADWVRHVHDFLLFGPKKPNGSDRPLTEAYISFKQKLGKRVSNVKSSHRWETVSGNLSVLDKQRLDRFIEKEGFSSVGSYISWTLRFHEDKKSIEDKFNSLVHDYVRGIKLKYIEQLEAEIQTVRKLVGQLAAYIEVFGTVTPEAEESNAARIAERTKKLMNDLPEMLGKRKKAKAPQTFDDLLNLHPVTEPIKESKQDEILTIRISRPQLESMKAAIDLVGEEFESIRQGAALDKEV